VQGWIGKDLLDPAGDAKTDVLVFTITEIIAWYF
jgi:hypothetical protein